MGYPASEKLPARPAYYDGHGVDRESNAGLKLLALFLGLAVGVMIPVGLVLAHSAPSARTWPGR